MNAEKQDVETKLVEMRAQADRVVNQLTANLGDNKPFSVTEVGAMADFVHTAADLGHAVDRLLAALEWEEGQ